METNAMTHPQSDHDALIGALLDRAHGSASIVDSLLAMPLPGDGGAAPQWNAALTRRLERRLAEAMRAIVEPAHPEDGGAGSALP